MAKQAPDTDKGRDTVLCIVLHSIVALLYTDTFMQRVTLNNKIQ